jgi:arylsulfatase A-like enzyme
MKKILVALTIALLSTAATAQPNVIVIMLDDAPDILSLMPKTSALLSQATRYTNSFANNPLCGPSRATFLTGQESGTHGVTTNGSGFLADTTGLVPDALRDAGYVTALFGKSPNGFRGAPSELGFDRWATLIYLGDARYFDPDMDVDGTAPEFRRLYDGHYLRSCATLDRRRERTLFRVGRLDRRPRPQ